MVCTEPELIIIDRSTQAEIGMPAVCNGCFPFSCIFQHRGHAQSVSGFQCIADTTDVPEGIGRIVFIIFVLKDQLCAFVIGLVFHHRKFFIEQQAVYGRTVIEFLGEFVGASPPFIFSMNSKWSWLSSHRAMTSSFTVYGL